MDHNSRAKLTSDLCVYDFGTGKKLSAHRTGQRSQGWRLWGKIAGVDKDAARGKTKTRNFQITKICVVSYNSGPDTGFKLVDPKGELLQAT